MSEFAVEPAYYLRYLREVEGLSASETRLPPRLVLVFGSEDLRTTKRMLHARFLRWNDQMAVGKAGARRVAVVRTHIGAPAACVVLEELIALGVREVIAFGACGSLVRSLPIGSLILPTRAYVDEGASRHYGGERWQLPHRGLVTALRRASRRRGLEVAEGGTWTTDAPYRERWTRARALARQGVVSVEMEASALYAVARTRKVRCASLFVVSDELSGDEWNAGFRNPAYRAAKRKALRVVLDVMAGRSS